MAQNRSCRITEELEAWVGDACTVLAGFLGGAHLTGEEATNRIQHGLGPSKCTWVTDIMDASGQYHGSHLQVC